MINPTMRIAIEANSIAAAFSRVSTLLRDLTK